ncbi:MAG: radical SAM protein [Candidatus Margulisbacteria bacterium]|jgi:molybdenum cofactor biosynthesis enzyme MoaA|nr:radical SAM protein [Candidatus Margulisiibacteriota bacterium]
MFLKTISGLNCIVEKVPDNATVLRTFATTDGTKYWIELPTGAQSLSSSFENSLNELENSRLQEARQTLAKFNNIWSIVLLVTDKCNANCQICLRYRDASPELQFSEMQKIVDALQRFDVKRISFTGGEPLLNPNLVELIKYAHQAGLLTSLSTNGTLVSKEFIDSVNGSLDEIIIPFDGSISEIFLKLAPYGTSEHIKHLKTLFRYIEEKSTISLKPITVASQLNLSDLPSIGQTLSSQGVKLWKIDEYYAVNENAGATDFHQLAENEFETALFTLKTLYPKLTIIAQGAQQRKNNAVFFIAASGQVVQNKKHQNLSIGFIFNKPADFLGNSQFYSNTSVANYTNGASKANHSFDLNGHYLEQFQKTHQQLLASLNTTGKSQVFTPHIDYGANIMVPQYLRSAIYQDFAQYHYHGIWDDYYEITPDLYSIGIYPLGRHLTDTRFYTLENLWKKVRQNQLTVTGPFGGEGCLFYLVVPLDTNNYFEQLKLLFQDSFGKVVRKTTNDTAVGWINVARTRRAIPQNFILSLQETFYQNNKILGSFYPTTLGAIKADWQENVYDAETALID